MSSVHQIIARDMIPPAQLWVGQSPIVDHAVCQYLQTILCKTACGVCVLCRRIAAHTHHAVCWIAPEKNQYTKADCEIIAQKCSFMLEDDEHFFFHYHGSRITDTSNGK